MRVSSCRPLVTTFSTNRCCLAVSGPADCSSRTSENPMIELSGVRSSWLIFARKSDLA